MSGRHKVKIRDKSRPGDFTPCKRLNNFLPDDLPEFESNDDEIMEDFDDFNLHKSSAKYMSEFQSSYSSRMDDKRNSHPLQRLSGSFLLDDCPEHKSRDSRIRVRHRILKPHEMSFATRPILDDLREYDSNDNLLINKFINDLRNCDQNSNSKINKLTMDTLREYGQKGNSEPNQLDGSSTKASLAAALLMVKSQLESKLAEQETRWPRSPNKLGQEDCGIVLSPAVLNDEFKGDGSETDYIEARPIQEDKLLTREQVSATQESSSSPPVRNLRKSIKSRLGAEGSERNITNARRKWEEEFLSDQCMPGSPVSPHQPGPPEGEQQQQDWRPSKRLRGEVSLRGSVATKSDRHRQRTNTDGSRERNLSICPSRSSPHSHYFDFTGNDCDYFINSNRTEYDDDGGYEHGERELGKYREKRYSVRRRECNNDKGLDEDRLPVDRQSTSRYEYSEHLSSRSNEESSSFYNKSEWPDDIGPDKPRSPVDRLCRYEHEKQLSSRFREERSSLRKNEQLHGIGCEKNRSPTDRLSSYEHRERQSSRSREERSGYSRIKFHTLRSDEPRSAVRRSGSLCGARDGYELKSRSKDRELRAGISRSRDKELREEFSSSRNEELRTKYSRSPSRKGRTRENSIERRTLTSQSSSEYSRNDHHKQRYTNGDTEEVDSRRSQSGWDSFREHHRSRSPRSPVPTSWGIVNDQGKYNYDGVTDQQGINRRKWFDEDKSEFGNHTDEQTRNREAWVNDSHLHDARDSIQISSSENAKSERNIYDQRQCSTYRDEHGESISGKDRNNDNLLWEWKSQNQNESMKLDVNKVKYEGRDSVRYRNETKLGYGEIKQEGHSEVQNSVSNLTRRLPLKDKNHRQVSIGHDGENTDRGGRDCDVSPHSTRTTRNILSKKLLSRRDSYAGKDPRQYREEDIYNSRRGNENDIRQAGRQRSSKNFLSQNDTCSGASYEQEESRYKEGRASLNRRKDGSNIKQEDGGGQHRPDSYDQVKSRHIEEREMLKRSRTEENYTKEFDEGDQNMDHYELENIRNREERGVDSSNRREGNDTGQLSEDKTTDTRSKAVTPEPPRISPMFIATQNTSIYSSIIPINSTSNSTCLFPAYSRVAPIPPKLSAGLFTPPWNSLVCSTSAAATQTLCHASQYLPASSATDISNSIPVQNLSNSVTPLDHTTSNPSKTADEPNPSYISTTTPASVSPNRPTYNNVRRATIYYQSMLTKLVSDQRCLKHFASIVEAGLPFTISVQISADQFHMATALGVMVIPFCSTEKWKYNESISRWEQKVTPGPKSWWVGMKADGIFQHLNFEKERTTGVEFIIEAKPRKRKEGPRNDYWKALTQQIRLELNTSMRDKQDEYRRKSNRKTGENRSTRSDSKQRSHNFRREDDSYLNTRRRSHSLGRSDSSNRNTREDRNHQTKESKPDSRDKHKHQAREDKSKVQEDHNQHTNKNKTNTIQTNNQETKECLSNHSRDAESKTSQHSLQVAEMPYPAMDNMGNMKLFINHQPPVPFYNINNSLQLIQSAIHKKKEIEILVSTEEPKKASFYCRLVWAITFPDGWHFSRSFGKWRQRLHLPTLQVRLCSFLNDKMVSMENSKKQERN